MKYVLLFILFLVTFSSCVMVEPPHIQPNVYYGVSYYPRPYYTHHVRHYYNCQHNYYNHRH